LGPYRCRKSINLICIWPILIYRHHLIHDKSTIGAEFGLLDERIDVCVPDNRVRSDRFNYRTALVKRLTYLPGRRYLAKYAVI